LNQPLWMGLRWQRQGTSQQEASQGHSLPSSIYSCLLQVANQDWILTDQPIARPRPSRTLECCVSLWTWRTGVGGKHDQALRGRSQPTSTWQFYGNDDWLEW